MCAVPVPVMCCACDVQVGGLLGLIAVFLVQKNRDLLLGRSMNSAETRCAVQAVQLWWLR